MICFECCSYSPPCRFFDRLRAEHGSFQLDVAAGRAATLAALLSEDDLAKVAALSSPGESYILTS